MLLTFEARELAKSADVDERTVRSYLDGGTVRTMSEEAIVKAAKRRRWWGRVQAHRAMALKERSCR